MNHPQVARLSTLGVLRVTGADARRFLQGQLSQDVDRLSPVVPLTAGLHSPQGRVLAILHLLADADAVLLLLPVELLETVRSLLARYVLRAKVQVEDASARFSVYGVADGARRALLARPTGAPAPDGTDCPPELWRAGDVAAGVPQVYASTSGRFVAQMLNLDRVEGVSFTKGCYTGQEIIARAHYRGRVKRRMQRYVTRDPAKLVPGDRVQLSNGAMADIVEVAPRDRGAMEFLAVAPLPDVQDEGAAESAAAAQISAESLPLPYSLEE